MNTTIEKKDIWEWNSIILYETVLLKDILSKEKPVIQVQKIALKLIDMILEQWFWIKEEVSHYFWRSWVLEISMKDYWNIIFLSSKWSDSVNAFAPISNFYLWGSDIVEKINAIWKNPLKKITQTPGEILWKYKTELLLLIGSKSIKKYNIDNTQIENLYTKFSPILTQSAISKLNKNDRIPQIIETDSNSELAIQVWEWVWKISAAVEIIQSWKSVVSTNNYIIRNNKIYKPSVRNIKNGEFEWDIIWEIKSDSQIGIISQNIHTEINIDFCEFKPWYTMKNNTFIKKIINTMNRIA